LAFLPIFGISKLHAINASTGGVHAAIRRCAQFVREKETVAAIMRLGYPAYFVAILGFRKVLGGIALLGPRFRTLKEWPTPERSFF
jgi:hypothetical protein